MCVGVHRGQGFWVISSYWCYHLTMPEGVLSGTRANLYKPHNCEVDIILYPLSAEIKLEYGEAQWLAHSAGKGKTRISRLRFLVPGPESSTTLSIWQKFLAHSQCTWKAWPVSFFLTLKGHLQTADENVFFSHFKDWIFYKLIFKVRKTWKIHSGKKINKDYAKISGTN